MNAVHALNALKKLQNPARAELQYSFMRCGKGEYAEGDRFLGLTVPQTRSVARAFKNLPTADLMHLLRDQWHEARLLALIILVQRAKNKSRRQEAIELYLEAREGVNHWDLVDLSAPYLLGPWVFQDERRIDAFLYHKNPWQRRMAILATFYFIRQGQLEFPLKILREVLTDPFELNHKALGWMLREVGKKNQSLLLDFLDQFTPVLPRIALSYALEKLPEERRQNYLNLPVITPSKSRLLRLQEGNPDLEEFLHLNQDYYTMLGKPDSKNRASNLWQAPPTPISPVHRICVGLYKGKAMIGLLDALLHHPKRNEAYIGLLLVKPVERRKSYGRILVRWFLELCSILPIKEIQLAIHLQNKPSQQLFQNFGFYKRSEPSLASIGSGEVQTYFLEIKTRQNKAGRA